MQEVLPGVYMIDKYSLKSFGNSGYFVKHEKGNILVDAPELKESDADFIGKNGGLAYIFITHIRAFGDACRIKGAFNAKLAIHEEDAKLVKGCAPDITFKDVYSLYSDVTLIPTIGYSPGSSSMLLARNGGALFCGDLFWIGNRDRYSSELMSWPTEEDKKTWFQADDLVLNINLMDADIAAMTSSAQKLMNYDFESLLMSHPHYPPRGRGIVASGAKKMVEKTLQEKKVTQFTDWRRE